MKHLWQRRAEQAWRLAPPPYRSIDDLQDATLLDALADAFTFPEDLALVQPDYGFMARVRDGQRIREDFRKAVENLGIEEGEPAPR